MDDKKNALVLDNYFPNSSRRLLVVAGELKLCPYQSPLLIPKAGGGLLTQSNEVTPSYRGCGSWCPLFDIHRDENGKALNAFIHCGNMSLKVPIDSEESNKQPVLGVIGKA